MRRDSFLSTRLTAWLVCLLLFAGCGTSIAWSSDALAPVDLSIAHDGDHDDDEHGDEQEVDEGDEEDEEQEGDDHEEHGHGHDEDGDHDHADDDHDESEDDEEDGDEDDAEAEADEDDEEADSDDGKDKDPEAVAALKRQNEMQAEKARLALEYSLAQQRQQNELARMELEMKEIETRIKLEQTRQSEELAEMKREVERLSTQSSLEAARRKKAYDSYKVESELLAAQNDLLKQKMMKIKTEYDLATIELQAKLADVDRANQEADAREKASSRVTEAIDYRKNPFQDGVLYVTDRRISLNGVISMNTADYVSERIHYFNNKSSEDPIFIIIDSSPGGSVMAGYRILKAMEASDAPIHVVVKSFAASMAAITTTLAEHSYAYPNAIMLHHQMSGGIFGNMSEQAEQLEVMKEWASRLMEPLAAKLDTTPDELVERMYENSVTGDWEEFADVAEKLNWVDHIVHEIRELAVDRQPGSNGAGSPLARVTFDGEEQVDAKGRRYKLLPRLQPFDFYMIHNPDSYYRYE